MAGLETASSSNSGSIANLSLYNPDSVEDGSWTQPLKAQGQPDLNQASALSSRFPKFHFPSLLSTCYNQQAQSYCRLWDIVRSPVLVCVIPSYAFQMGPTFGVV